MPEDKAGMVDATKNLIGETVGLPNRIHYLPFKDTAECALDTSMQGHAFSIPMAREVTVWKILELDVDRAAALQMVQTGKLVRDINRHGWRFFGNLDYGCLSHQWYRVTLPCMGVDSWTERFLMPTFRVSVNSACCQCHKQTATWREHCGDCWLDFLQEKTVEPMTMAE